MGTVVMDAIITVVVTTAGTVVGITGGTTATAGTMDITDTIVAVS